ncbi:MAG: NfeD family protein [Microcoleus sp.]
MAISLFSSLSQRFWQVASQLVASQLVASQPVVSVSQTAAKQAAIASIQENTDKVATVTETIKPGQRGRIYFQGTTWFAICPYDVVLPPKARVRIIAEPDSTTLIVEPVPEGTNPAVLSVAGV